MYWSGALGLVATAAASFVVFRQLPIASLQEQFTLIPVVSSTASSTAATPAPAPAATPAKPKVEVEANSVKATDQRPVFDIISVETTGDAVIAGHASPKAAVELRDDGLVLAKVSADASGQFAILPPPLSAGGHHLQLAARTDAATDALSDAVAVNVETTPAKTSSAPSLTQTSRVAAAEVAKPSEAPLADATIKDIRTAKVIRGDNLWRISEHYLRNGTLYQQIYAANASQVRSPHLIYPGQVLVIPQAPAPRQ
jgi:nucleoid-associated protein YgaU